MNRKDIVMISICLLVIIILFLVLTMAKEKGRYAIVTYQNQEILKIDLKNNNHYTVTGNNGDVVIEVKNQQIRVNEENSPYHYCSKQGYISKTGESIICLPNQIIITIVGENEIDTQVK